MNRSRIAELQLWAEQVREQSADTSLPPAERKHFAELYKALQKTVEEEKAASDKAA